MQAANAASQFLFIRPPSGNVSESQIGIRLLCRGGRLCPPVGSSCSTEIFGNFRCSRAFDCRGRCRSQPFATKERYGCGSAACRYTSARAVCTVFTIICGEFAASQWADVGIGPYIKTGRCIRMRPSFLQNRCILRADRVVRPYADFSFVKQSTTKRTRLQCGKSAQYLLFGEFMLQ